MPKLILDVFDIFALFDQKACIFRVGRFFKNALISAGVKTMIFNFLVLPLSIWPFGVFKRILAYVAMSYGKTEYLPQGDKDFPKRQDVNFLVLPIGYEPFNLSRCDPLILRFSNSVKCFLVCPS